MTLTEKVIKRLVIWGWNKEDATILANSKFGVEYVVRVFEETRPAKIADIITTL